MTDHPPETANTINLSINIVEKKNITFSFFLPEAPSGIRCGTTFHLLSDSTFHLLSDSHDEVHMGSFGVDVACFAQLVHNSNL